MKRVIITLLLLTFNVVVFSQTTPTKEETIKWINQKIHLYGFKGKTEVWDNNAQTEWIFYHHIYTSLGYIKLTRQGRKFNTELSPEMDYQQIYFSDICKVTKGNLGGNNVPMLQLSSCNNPSSILYVLIKFDSEQDLYDRMFKAFQNLINANKPPKSANETF
jgi:hypothetical protein